MLKTAIYHQHLKRQQRGSQSDLHRVAMLRFAADESSNVWLFSTCSNVSCLPKMQRGRDELRVPCKWGMTEVSGDAWSRAKDISLSRHVPALGYHTGLLSSRIWSDWSILSWVKRHCQDSSTYVFPPSQPLSSDLVPPMSSLHFLGAVSLIRQLRNGTCH